MSRTGSIHWAKLEKSPRLQAVLASLQYAGSRGRTTREIIAWAEVCAVNSIIAEPRKNGYAISCTFEGRSPGGAAIFRYRLTPTHEAPHA